MNSNLKLKGLKLLICGGNAKLQSYFKNYDLRKCKSSRSLRYNSLKLLVTCILNVLQTPSCPVKHVDQ